MQLWDKLAEYAKNFSSYRTTMDFGDVAEILIIAVLLYYTLVWMKTTRAWILLKGLVVILVFLLLAYFFRMTTILWMAQNVLGFAVTALIVVLQPELRKALEEKQEALFIACRSRKLNKGGQCLLQTFHLRLGLR